MDHFTSTLSTQIENWVDILEEINPISIFVASAMGGDGPVHLGSGVWGKSIATILRENLSCSDSDTWTVYLCLGRATPEPKRSKSPEVNVSRNRVVERSDIDEVRLLVSV